MFSLNKITPTITDMIRFDHSHVTMTFHQYTAASKPKVKKALAETMCAALEIHATLEEEFFYPVVRKISGTEPVIDKSVPEHNEMRRLIADLRATNVGDVRHDQLVYQLMRDVMHHVADEETVLLPEAERMLSPERLSELGVQMTKRRLELVAAQPGKLTVDTAVACSGSTTAIVVGVAGALMAAKLLTKKPAPAH